MPAEVFPMRLVSFLLRRPPGARSPAPSPSVLPAGFAAALQDPDEAPRCVVTRVARDAAGHLIAVEWGVMDAGLMVWLAGPETGSADAVAAALAGGLSVGVLFPTPSGLTWGGHLQQRDAQVVFAPEAGSGWTVDRVAQLTR
jgi:hypothetical protein